MSRKGEIGELRVRGQFDSQQVEHTLKELGVMPEDDDTAWWSRKYGNEATNP